MLFLRLIKNLLLTEHQNDENSIKFAYENKFSSFFVPGFVKFNFERTYVRIII